MNAIRNTLYLFLKHFGLFGKRGAALRLTFLSHLGLLSAIRRPSKSNFAYLAMALRSRASAYGHYCKYLIGPRVDTPEAFRVVVDADERGASQLAAAAVGPTGAKS